MPLMSDLEYCLRNDDQLEFFYPTLCEFIKKINRLSDWSLNEIYSIENILTVILTKSLYKSIEDRQFYERLTDDILKFVEHTIIEASDTIDKINARTIIKHFVWLAIRNQSAVVTFNYDGLIENSTHRPIHLCVNRYPEEINSGTPSGKFKLIKIHGSLDWYRTLGSERTELETVKFVPRNSYYHHIHKDQTPVFIPMSHNKDSFFKGSLFNTLWTMAISSLNEADEIVFIGYSFPKTDINNLIDFLEYKDKIKHIVIYKSNSADTERLKNIFGDRVIEKDAKDYITELILHNLPDDPDKESYTQLLRSCLLNLQTNECEVYK